MTTKTASTFRIEDELLEGLQAIKARDGIPLSEQVRRALKMWLDSKGVGGGRADRKRAQTRKRP